MCLLVVLKCLFLCQQKPKAIATYDVKEQNICQQMKGKKKKNPLWKFSTNESPKTHRKRAKSAKQKWIKSENGHWKYYFQDQYIHVHSCNSNSTLNIVLMLVVLSRYKTLLYYQQLWGKNSPEGQDPWFSHSKKLSPGQHLMICRCMITYSKLIKPLSWASDPSFLCNRMRPLVSSSLSRFRSYFYQTMQYFLLYTLWYQLPDPNGVTLFWWLSNQKCYLPLSLSQREYELRSGPIFYWPGNTLCPEYQLFLICFEDLH